MTAKTRTHRATAWLCLALALLVALLPTAGVMMCLGHDGHVGVGSVAEVAVCPCAPHEARAPSDGATGAPRHDDEHPSCVDMALRGENAVQEAASPRNAAGESSPPCEPPRRTATVEPAPERRVAAAAATGAAAVRPPEHLRHRRAVVLLV